jgi:hypothetical protein
MKGKNKKTPIKQKIMLDVEFNKHENEVEKNDKMLLNLQQKHDKLESDINLVKREIGKLTTDELMLYHLKLDELDDLKDKINKIENCNSMDYYIKNGKILSDYYTSFNTNNKNRLSLLNEYLEINDPNYTKQQVSYNNDEYCKNCNTYREIISSESIMICPDCGEQIDNIIDYDKPSYKDPQQENSKFKYERLKHFKDHLLRIQAKQSKQIPQIIYDVILYECAKNRITNLALLNEEMVKLFLSKYMEYGFNNYYENAYKIIYKLTNIEPLNVPVEIEEELCQMFLKIEEPFDNNKPNDRFNLISYPYVFYKLCEIKGYKEYLKYFNLLKTNDKLFEQDKTWKMICQANGWKFYESIRI